MVEGQDSGKLRGLLRPQHVVQPQHRQLQHFSIQEQQV
jgi:hypothetical protein